MDSHLVEKVTKLVLSKLEEQENSKSKEERPGVTLWDYKSSEPIVRESASIQSEELDSGQVVFSPYTEERENKKTNVRREVHISEEDRDSHSDELKELMNKTPARIGVGRVGPRPKTNTWLKFRYDHAAAADAVSGSVSEEILQSLQLFSVQTNATDNDTYIRRPDYGRRLSDEAKKLIKNKCTFQPEVQIIISDGLSSKAIEENVEDVYLSLEQSLESLGYDTGTPFYIEKGRVAVMDDVGELLQPKVIVLLIGERPGLISAESLSVYMCYEPRNGTIEADRMVVSNIHRGGIPPVEAGAYLGTVVEKILKYEASGVSLVQKEK